MLSLHVRELVYAYRVFVGTFMYLVNIS